LLNDYIKNKFLGKTLNYFSGDVILTDGESKQVSIALLREISELVKRRDATLIIVLSPSKKVAEGESSKIHIWYTQHLTKQGYRYFDMVDVIQSQELPGKVLYRDAAHYTKIGNQLYADAVKQYLFENIGQ
jgi:hypothetical protein